MRQASEAAGLGFRLPNERPERAGAAQFASLLLTVAHPQRFVDYRIGRWRKLANELGYPTPRLRNHAEGMLWAAEFARAVAVTRCYGEHWPATEARFSNPLWVLSGIACVGVTPRLPDAIPPTAEDMSFSEGQTVARLHFARERSSRLVRAAKDAAYARDPTLPCKICGLSFVKKYGPHGDRYIEAHHTVPLADLKKGTKTRVEDLALLCGNCHRMIHRGERSLTIEELKALLRDGHAAP